jgi:hypothetical protein
MFLRLPNISASRFSDWSVEYTERRKYKDCLIPSEQVVAEFGTDKIQPKHVAKPSTQGSNKIEFSMSSVSRISGKCAGYANIRVAELRHDQHSC